MKALKYKIIKSEAQYNQYCDILEELISHDSKENQDEIELLTFLIEKWDEEHNSFNDLNPIESLKALMKENELKAKDLAKILNLSKGTISKILNYHKGLSKDSIRNLAHYFKISQEAFNCPYPLKTKVINQSRNSFNLASSNS
tara:strand:+ start:17 stop:445 length:429 start_codon:yes stop_codon:yes gene_type:complete